MSRNLRAIEPAQRCGDIGQQRAGDEVTAHEAHQPRDSASDTSSSTSTRLSIRAETPQARKGAQHRQPLFEGKPDRRIDDEESDKE